MTTKSKLVVLIGPTAVGKTDTSIKLAKAFNGEIISGDSMQVYKYMDIGTAKIKPAEMDGIPHYLIDIKHPTEAFSAAEFQELVRKKISDITKRGKLPIIVGGTGLYIQSVLYDYQFSEAPTNDEFRKQLEEVADKEGNLLLHNQLSQIDSNSAAKIHPNNIRRVIRALEIYHCTGKTMSEWQDTQEQEPLYDTAVIGLTMERELLYERINKRVDLMMEEGLLKEVEKLYQQGVRNCQSVQAIGYKELYEYFDGKIALSEAVENLKQNSRRYAKRQLTWFRNKMDVQWFDMTTAVVPNEREKKITEIFSYIEGKLKIKSNT
ncbi:tRNA (adenosine(37)-N6)-dimethylallyltransferase MiaA [Bacillus tuaregi]|uniref:tRNA (adenosine(37)-N6)-dimethylallyltransferase MiaA n=1 Tax=Bacillus tuaregi TaxID=1816695 RepID=UPI0008F832E2|nr:tRNA (adenosine(37)-N6)-dimethylallyltransferase MiaA [Bacillus tuaregi]